MGRGGGGGARSTPSRCLSCFVHVLTGSGRGGGTGAADGVHEVLDVGLETGEVFYAEHLVGVSADDADEFLLIHVVGDAHGEHVGYPAGVGPFRLRGRLLPGGDAVSEQDKDVLHTVTGAREQVVPVAQTGGDVGVAALVRGGPHPAGEHAAVVGFQREDD